MFYILIPSIVLFVCGILGWLGLLNQGEWKQFDRQGDFALAVEETDSSLDLLFQMMESEVETPVSGPVS